jgi:ABC-type amino acid transport substrate-binding protein
VGRFGSSALVAALLLAGCGEFPKDANGTLEEVRAGRPLRVGWSAAEPWVRSGPDGPFGPEVDLLRAWAETIGARIEWAEASEAQLVEALGENAVDLGLASFTAEAPWGARIGQTQPYLRSHLAIGVREGVPVPDDWKGVAVRYDRRRPQVAGALRGIGAAPVPAEAGDLGPIGAAYEEELVRAGLRPTEKRLASEDRVIATAPAENALALALDRFLHGREVFVRERLVAEAAR